MIRKLTAFSAVIAVAMLAALGAAQAQGGFFGQGSLLDKGKKMLGNLGGSESGAAALSTEEIISGLKEALRVGTETVVGQLGTVDGFNADSAIHIPLPESLQPVQNALSRVGLSSLTDDLETRLNRAAEVATPKAKKLFWDAISAMTLEDAKRIYDGPEDAATRYFQERTSASLAQEMRPIVEESLAEVGAVQAYDTAIGRYKALPFVPDAKADLTDYVVDKGMAGIFHYIALEEAAIRKDPLKQSTAILKRVFGGA